MQRFLTDEAYSGKISVKENSSRLEFDCKGRTFVKAKIDCQKFNQEFGNNQERCDYAIVSESTKDQIYDIVMFVELKGSNPQKAFSQIAQTKSLFSSSGNKFNKSYAAIVCKRIPKAGSDIQAIKVKAKRYNFTELFYSGQSFLALRYDLSLDKITK